ncbi:Lipoyl synthase [compost metagenome]
MSLSKREAKPKWLKIKLNTNERFKEIKSIMCGKELHTVCEEAKCPNIYECWSNRTATFMILGSVCTRACRFCAVHTGLPTELDEAEPQKVAIATKQMGFSHVESGPLVRSSYHTHKQVKQVTGAK